MLRKFEFCENFIFYLLKVKNNLVKLLLSGKVRRKCTLPDNIQNQAPHSMVANGIPMINISTSSIRTMGRV